MRNNYTFGTEIIRVTVQNGYADQYIGFESNLTRILNRRYPDYHLGGEIYQSICDPNKFFIIALYKNYGCDMEGIATDLENFVELKYASCFPYTESRSIITDQDENVLVDRCFNK